MDNFKEELAIENAKLIATIKRNHKSDIEFFQSEILKTAAGQNWVRIVNQAMVDRWKNNLGDLKIVFGPSFKIYCSSWEKYDDPAFLNFEWIL